MALELNLEGDRYVVFTRHVDAPPALVYCAHIEPALIQRWMLGPDGWSMPVCHCDPPSGRQLSLRVGRCQRQRLLRDRRVHGADAVQPHGAH